MSSKDDTHSDDNNPVGAYEEGGDDPFSDDDPSDDPFEDFTPDDNEGDLFDDSEPSSEGPLGDQDLFDDHSSSEQEFSSEFDPELEEELDQGEFANPDGEVVSTEVGEYNPDAEYLGPESTSATEYVAYDGNGDDLDHYDPSRADTIGPVSEKVEEEDSSLGWKWILFLIIFSIATIAAAVYGAYFLTKDDDDTIGSMLKQPTDESSLITDLNLPQNGEEGSNTENESSDPSSVEQLQAALSSLENEKSQLSSENQQLRSEGGNASVSTQTKTNTKTQFRTQTKTNTRTNTKTNVITETSTLPPPAPVTRVITRTAPPLPPSTVRVTETKTLPPRVVTRDVVRTETVTVPGRRITITRTIIDRPR